jgi:hypothetical protein
MFSTRLTTATLGLLAVGAAFALSGCSVPATPAAAAPVEAPSTDASTVGFSDATNASILASFDLTAGQLPENIVSTSGDAVAVTFAASRQVAEISAAGEIDILGTLPEPAELGTATPVLGFPLATGLALVDDTYYALYATGEADTTGLWNLDAGTILQIDIKDDGAAGKTTVVAADLVGIDDFAFTGRGDQIVATLDPSSEVVLVQDGARTTVLTEQDGLSNPTSVLVQGTTIYVPSAAYVTQDNPNLLTATLK